MNTGVGKPSLKTPNKIRPMFKIALLATIQNIICKKKRSVDFVNQSNVKTTLSWIEF